MASEEETHGSPGPASGSKPRRERISQACEACRTQKARCRPSDVPGTCEKCLKAKKTCVPHIPKTSSSIGKGKRRSLAKMESRIEALYQLLHKASPEDQQRFHEAESSLNAIEDLSEDEEAPHQPSVHSRTSYSGPSSITQASGPSPQDPTAATAALASEWQAKATAGRPPSFPFSTNNISADSSIPMSDRLAAMLITALGWPHFSQKENYFKFAVMVSPIVEDLLKDFPRLLSNFPFVRMPAENSLTELVTQRPLLAAAMLVVSSAYDRPLLLLCDDLFQNAIATKAIVNGEKSLDVLQGLQVYVAWHQHFWDVAQMHVPVFISLATTIALELDFDGPLKSNVLVPEPINCEGLLKSTVYAPESLNIDGLRGLLGCYYVSSLQTGLGYNKPLSLSWSSTLERCATMVATYGTLEQDKYMPGMVSLLHIAEDIKAALRGPSSPTRHTLRENLHLNSNNDIRTALSYSHLEQRLRAWDADFPTKDLTWLTPTRHFLSIYLFESALLPCNSLAGGPDNPASSQRQLDLLAACLSAARLFLDGVLASPTLIIDDINIGVWAHVLGVVIAVTRLSRPLPPELAKNLYWDHLAARNAVNISQYTSALAQRMREQAARRPARQQRPKLIDFFESVTAKIADTVSRPEEASGETPDGAIFDNVRHYATKPRRPPHEMANLNAEDEVFWNAFMGLDWLGDLGI